MSKSLRATPSVEELQELSESLEEENPQGVLSYALNQFSSKIVLACSFGPEDLVLWDMMYQINSQSVLFYLDTDFLFKETYDVRDQIVEKYNLKPEQIIQVKPQFSPQEQTAKFGSFLWVNHPEQCCQIRKVDPLIGILKQYDAWITGIRRSQSPTRSNASLVGWDEKFGLVKFNPLATWTNDEVWAYIKTNNIPYNILHDQHYPSIGCTHCTAPIRPGDDTRSGRWKNSEKTECGLHQ